VADATAAPRRDLAAGVVIPKLRYNGQFSRTGDWIYFLSQTADDSSSVWRVRSDMSGVVELLIARDRNEYVFDKFPFPDDRSIAIAKEVGRSPSQMFRLDLASKQLTPITAMPFGSKMAVSPAGDRIAWTEFSGDVFVVNADGTGRRRVATGMNLERPAWTRNSRYLVAVPLTGGFSGCVIDTVTGNVTPLPWNRVVNNVQIFGQVGGRP
jgi:Tol biopolymer transport system component